MHRIREREPFIEARKKLSPPRGPQNSGADPRGESALPSLGKAERKGTSMREPCEGRPRLEAGGPHPAFSSDVNSPGSEPPNLPGARARAVRPSDVWSSCFSVLGRAKTPLSSFWHSLRSAKPGAEPGLKGHVWPMPIPFLSLHLPHANRKQRDLNRKLALNATVLALTWLYLGQPASVTPLRLCSLMAGSSGGWMDGGVALFFAA